MRKECNGCLKRNLKRDRREGAVGMFHTTIIHYKQAHPDSSFISKMVKLDSSCVHCDRNESQGLWS